MDLFQNSPGNGAVPQSHSDQTEGTWNGEKDTNVSDSADGSQQNSATRLNDIRPVTMDTDAAGDKITEVRA